MGVCTIIGRLERLKLVLKSRFRHLKEIRYL
jgi:hypothetical protein